MVAVGTRGAGCASILVFDVVLSGGGKPERIDNALWLSLHWHRWR